MTIWHVIALILAVIGYQNGRSVIKEKYHNAGLRVSGFFQRPDRYYREGNDAVAVGRITILFSVLLALTVITEILGLHNFTLEFFVGGTIVINILIGYLYPTKREIPASEKMESENELQADN